MLKKSELFNMLNRDFKELDLRYFSLKTRENLNNQNNVFVINIKNFCLFLK